MVGGDDIDGDAEAGELGGNGGEEADGFQAGFDGEGDEAARKGIGEAVQFGFGAAADEGKTFGFLEGAEGGEGRGSGCGAKHELVRVQVGAHGAEEGREVGLSGHGGKDGIGGWGIARLTNISKIRIILLASIAVLKPADFHILLALAGGPLHGYGIMKNVERDTAGEVTLEIGSLYRLLARLVSEGMIHHVDGADERRRYYRITASGRKVLRAEAARLASVVMLVRSRKLLPEADV